MNNTEHNDEFSSLGLHIWSERYAQIKKLIQGFNDINRDRWIGNIATIT